MAKRNAGPDHRYLEEIATGTLVRKGLQVLLPLHILDVDLIVGHVERLNSFRRRIGVPTPQLKQLRPVSAGTAS